MKLRHQLLLLSVMLFGATTFAQTIHIPVHKDTIVMDVPETGGAIQWQRSSDNVNWTDVPGATSKIYNYTVNTNELPVHFRSRYLEGSCQPYYSETQSVTTDMPTFYWSDPAAWQSGVVPVDEDSVVIPTGRRIYLDINTAKLAGLNVMGNLEFLDRDLELSSDYILVHGLLAVGSDTSLYTKKAIFTLTGENIAQDIMGMGTRGIMVMGGKLELHALHPQTTFTKINAHAAAGSSLLSLVNAPDWKVNDQIVVAPTDFFNAANGKSISQRVSISQINGGMVTIGTPLDAFRWGLLQYATPGGMSLDSSNKLSPNVADTLGFHQPTVLDERAEVGNLTRNILIRSLDDNLWQAQGFGVHVMVMGTGAEARLNGVEIQRAGQRNRMGRYPFHWHMLSYSGTATLPDVTNQYFKNSTVNQSRNRGVVIHGTNGVVVQKNVIFDIEGHGIFTEDAVERRNLIDSNLVLKVRNPQVNPAQALKQHEVRERGSSCFWISNPDNTVTNNVAADCSTNGFWLPFPSQPWGLCSSVLAGDGLLMNPGRMLFGVFDNNTAHSNRMEGIMLDFVEINNAGEVNAHSYHSTTDGRDEQWPFPTLRRFTLSRYKTWKNTTNGMWDRSLWANNFEATSADNCGRFFGGAGDQGLISHSLVVGTSLNHMMNNTNRPAQADFSGTYSSSAPAAFATYHSTFDIKNNIAIGFPAVEKQRTGVFATDDYYIRPVEKGQARNYNNLIINSHPGVRLKAPYNYFSLSGALYDPNGIWGPAGNFVVYDDPFYTTGKTKIDIAPSLQVSGGVSVTGPFYGFQGFVPHGLGNTAPKNQPYNACMAIKVRRLNPATLAEEGNFELEGRTFATALANMRHFATSPDAYYELSFPADSVLPEDFQMTVENMMEESDVQVVAVQFDGSLNPAVRFSSGGSNTNYTLVNSLAEVSASAGNTYWQDKANNLVWVKLKGGTWKYWTQDPNVAKPTPDEVLYEPMTLRIYNP